MLGEKIGEISGKIIMQRVLPNLGGDPKMETSFQATGSVLDTNVSDTGTYWTVLRTDRTQYGEDQGVMIIRDGEMATWTGQWCRRKEQRRDRDLSAARFISKPCPHDGHVLTEWRCYSNTQ